MKYSLSVCILCAAIGHLSSCKSGLTDIPATNEKVCISDSLWRMIKIDSAQQQFQPEELKLSGEISFDDNKVLKVFPISGGQVLDVKATTGMYVQKGQVLAIIKSADITANYADLSNAEKDMAIARKQEETIHTLFDNGIASEKEYLEAKENLQKSSTSVRKMQESIAINGGGHTLPNGQYAVVAPLSGFVVEKNINQGAFIRPDNGSPLFTIGDISEVWVWANVYETDIAKVREGFEANVTTLAYPDSVFRGVVDNVSATLDPVTKVMRIRIKLSNKGKALKPEMFANIKIGNQSRTQRTTLPASAILSDNGKEYVIVYKDRCQLELRSVHSLTTINGLTYLQEGVQAGEKVISQNQLLLFNALKERL